MGTSDETIRIKKYPEGTICYIVKTIGIGFLMIISYFMVAALISFLLHDFSYFIHKMLNDSISFTLMTMMASVLATPSLRMYEARKIEPKRLKALQKNRWLLADWQPQPQYSEMPLIMRYRIKWKTRFIIGTIISLPLLFIVSVFFLVSSFIHPYQKVLLVISLLFVILASLASAIHMRNKTLIADEQGLSLAFGGKRRQYIPWEQARLFAISGILQRYTLAPPQKFELASEQEIITWEAQHWRRWNEQEGRFIMLDFEEGQRALQELNGLIAAKTELPLYDLRKPVR